MCTPPCRTKNSSIPRPIYAHHVLAPVRPSSCSRYEGDFLKGQIHGRGRYMWSDGGHYEASAMISRQSQQPSHYIPVSRGSVYYNNMSIMRRVCCFFQSGLISPRLVIIRGTLSSCPVSRVSQSTETGCISKRHSFHSSLFTPTLAEKRGGHVSPLYPRLSRCSLRHEHPPYRATSWLHRKVSGMTSDSPSRTVSDTAEENGSGPTERLITAGEKTRTTGLFGNIFVDAEARITKVAEHFRKRFPNCRRPFSPEWSWSVVRQFRCLCN